VCTLNPCVLALQTLGCLPIAHVDHMKAEKLGSAALVRPPPVARCLLSS
jgi:hypothetical protein